jgi:hypothetical protein
MINKTGLAEIASFLRENHTRAHLFGPKEISAWATEAEASMAECGIAMIEVGRVYSVTGAPVTFTVSREGIS